MCERLYAENKALNEESKALNARNQGLTERLIAAKEEEEERKLLAAQIADNDAQIADNRAQIARNDAQIADNRAQIAHLLEEERRLESATQRLESLRLNSVKEFQIKSLAASDYCASKDKAFGPCCLTLCSAGDGISSSVRARARGQNGDSTWAGATAILE